MNDEHFMKKAIWDAKHPDDKHFGAIVVKDNRIIARSGKKLLYNPTGHAETQAIVKACKKLKTKNLAGCILYSTCEPCPMCFYVAWRTNISKIVYGATIQDAEQHGFPQIKVSDRFLNKRGDERIKLKEKILRNECLKVFAG